MGASMMTAVKTPWRQSMPDFLQLLDGTLGHKVKLRKEALGYEIYLVDLSDWKLRFSDRTPMIIVKEGDLASMNARELAQSLTEVVRAHSLAERNPIVVAQGPADELKQQLRAMYQSILVIGDTDTQAIRESRRPSGELLDRLAPQLDLSLLAPYETSKPVTGSRFFGREFEVRRILQTPESIRHVAAALKEEGAAAPEADATAAVRDFDTLWNKLFPVEQARIIQLLVRRVTVTTSGLEVDLRREGIAGVIREMITPPRMEAAE